VAEVSRLATTIIVLSDGRVASAGPAADIMQRVDLFPMTGRAEAGAIIEAIIEGHDEDTGLTLLRSRAGLWRMPRLTLDSASRVRVRVRARDVMLSTSPLRDVSALNIFPAVVAELGDPSAPIVDVQLDCSGEFLVARLTRHSVERLGLARGVRVHAVIKAVALDRRSLSGPWRQTASADIDVSEA
jgi:molybdate transport system ATP-binding protein